MRPNATGHLVVAAFLLVGVVAAPAVRQMRPEAARYEVDLQAIPMEVNGMEGQVLPPDEGVQAYLEADVMRTVAYGEPPRSITASVIYGGSWRTVHSPAQCYPAAGWQVVWERDAIIPVDQDLPHGKPVLGRLMRVERDDRVQLVLFVFAHKGGTSIDYAEHAWAVQTGPAGAGGLSLMLSSAVTGSEEKTQGMLVAAASEIYPSVVSFWYKDWEPGNT